MPSSKLMKVPEAIELVKDGDELTISGMTFFRNPMMFIAALLKGGRKGLSFVDREPGFGLDVLVAGGALSRVRAAMATFEHYGLSPSVRRAAEKGEVEYIEDTCGAIIAGLRAGAQGVPFMPVRGIIGSDLLPLHEKRGNWKVIKDPFSGEDLVVVKAIEPDVAVIHVQVSDEYGNALIRGPRYEDELKIRASKRVVITAEKVVPSDVMREIAKNEGATLSASSVHVTAVVEAPGGAWPTGVYGLYEPDYAAIKEYYEMAKAGRAYEWIASRLLTRWPL
ncbi:MAG: Acyl CoA:acetate/3-ketoacid CoA transferase, alpha subunit [uncultured Acidilobus sp. JCHS]|jgi:glutaconate CoA-transferase subunit A|nr:MAG: Acyl CoA:acetate/3-ketoacid CoA transferase, alpha subunit [uncultured Acidilobus sp. JCHS]